MVNRPTTITADLVSEALFQIDPMNTGCVENDMFDEYDALAVAIVDAVQAGEPLATALRNAFERSFWPDALESETLATCVAAIDHEAAAKTQ